MKGIKKLLQLAIAITICGSIAPNSLASGIPVVDAANLSQNVVNTAESIAQTLKQIEEYKTQLQQYQNQLQNTAIPTEFIWDQAVNTMTKLRAAVDVLNQYKQKLGSIDEVLNKTRNTEYYTNCYSNGGCSEEMEENRRHASEMQKASHDAAFRGLEQQHQSMVSDAQTLERLQSSAQGATGQMQALGYANQLASQQSAQLLQIRSLLATQQNALVARQQAVADREAQEDATSKHMRQSRFKKSSGRTW